MPFSDFRPFCTRGMIFTMVVRYGGEMIVQPFYQKEKKRQIPNNPAQNCLDLEQAQLRGNIYHEYPFRIYAMK